MRDVIKALAADLKDWAEQTQPIVRGEAVPAARFDQGEQNSRLDDLFFELSRPDSVTPSGGSETRFLRGQLLSTDAVRNSFYPELLKTHSAARQVALHLSVSGAFAYRLFQAGGHQPDEVIDDGVIENSRDAEAPLAAAVATLSLGSDIGQNRRLFWEVEALGDDAVLHDAVWSLTAPRDAGGRMIVVLRTFGRGEDVRALLAGFEAASRRSPVYGRILRNIAFLVLDTTPGVTAADYEDFAGFEALHAHVIAGANLGGGGNMSQILTLLEGALEIAEVVPDELLLLDDDLQISLESLCRHWASTLFRIDDTIFTLPVCMSSAPRRIWEDGAFWGRFLDRAMSGERTGIAPRLLRHGQDLGAEGQADRMAALHYPEYSTFIFFGLSYARFRELGYPPAFFLRGDDIEYSLRHGDAGGRCLSNPNLCAWHEPAHSYGQEYMSIAHGVIINMAHGNTSRDDFLRFFQARMMAHGNLYDAQGLRLYGAVLRDLNSRSVFLEHDFASHYIEMLGEFRKFDATYRYLPEELRADLRDNAHERGVRIVEQPFLYPGLYAGAEGGTVPNRVLLENPHTGHVRVYMPQEAGTMVACAEAMALFATELEQFYADFEALHAHYLERLATVSKREFWDKEITLHPDPTTLFAAT